MTPILVIAVVIGAVSFAGAAFLLALWHEDRASGTRGWPLSRVLAYLAIAGTLAANLLGAVSLLRLAEVPNFRELQLALSPMTLTAIIVLDLLFPVLALYLRAVRFTGYISSSERSGLATEASVQMAIEAARDAYHESNGANIKIADIHKEIAGLLTELTKLTTELTKLTEIVGTKEDKPGDGPRLAVSEDRP